MRSKPHDRPRSSEVDADPSAGTTDEERAKTTLFAGGAEPAAQRSGGNNLR